MDFLDNNLEVDQREVVQVLEEDPEFGHCRTVDHLHQLRNVHVLVALEALVRHVALVGEFFKHVGGVLMALVAPEEHTRFFSQRR